MGMDPREVWDPRYGRDWAGHAEIYWLTPWTFTAEICHGGVFNRRCAVDESPALREALGPAYEWELKPWLVGVGSACLVNFIISWKLVGDRRKVRREFKRREEARRTEEELQLNSSRSPDLPTAREGASDVRPSVAVGRPLVTLVQASAPVATVVPKVIPRARQADVEPAKLAQNLTASGTPKLSTWHVPGRRHRAIKPGPFSTGVELAKALKRDGELQRATTVFDGQTDRAGALKQDNSGKSSTDDNQSDGAMPMVHPVADPARSDRAARLARLAQGRFDAPSDHERREPPAKTNGDKASQKGGDDA